MKFTSIIVAAASGSVGGCTYSRNRFGAYIRSRAVPVNPSTIQQQTVRNLLAVYAARWGTLTQAVRDAWTNYAILTPTTDSLGNPITLTGLNMYLRSEVFKDQVVAPPASDAAPINPGFSTLTPPTIVPDVSTGLTITFTNTDSWATAVGGVLALYQSRAQSPSKSFFKGPYRFAGKILGAVVPPTSPVAFTVYPFPYAVGQAVFTQVRVMDSTLRVSGALRFRSLAVA